MFGHLDKCGGGMHLNIATDGQEQDCASCDIVN